MVLRRNLDGSELKYLVSNAPVTTSARTLGRVGATRWSGETDIPGQKEDIGLDEYEVRSWSGGYHHITLSLLAGAFLVQLHGPGRCFPLTYAHSATRLGRRATLFAKRCGMS